MKTRDYDWIRCIQDENEKLLIEEEVTDRWDMYSKRTNTKFIEVNCVVEPNQELINKISRIE